VPVDAAATEEAMLHHALSQQKEGDCQRNQKTGSFQLLTTVIFVLKGQTNSNGWS
jgi:hypothetical protein